jgi:putative aldouronate transport system substrate-binding protein
VKKLKLLSLVSALFLIFSLAAGCSGTKEAAATPEPEEPTQQPVETATPAPETTETAKPGPFKLPISAEPVTFTAFNPVNMSSMGMKDNNDSYAYQEAEKRTNIHIEWFHPSSSDAQTSFNLSIASGEYYDTYMVGAGSFTGGLDAFMDDNIIIDLTDLVKQYAPNYDYVRHLENTLITTVTDTGRLPGFWQIAKTYQWAFIGPLGRTDWLKELGMEIPETYDQMHEVLVAFRDQKNCEIPMSLNNNGIDDWLLAGYDTMYSIYSSSFIQIDGAVKYGPLEPGFKEYITMINKWYGEGLIDKEFYTRQNNPAFDTAFASAGKVGVGSSLYTFPDFLPLFAEDPASFEFNGFRPLVKNSGDKRKIAIGGAPLTLNKNLISVISTSCKDPVTLVKWYDYYFTEEGSLLANYGIEGQGFTYVDGKPKVTELIYADKDGRPMNSMFPWYTFYQVQGCWYDWERELSPKTSQNVYDTKERFDGNWVDEYTMPNVSMTSEEGAEYAAIIGDINTYLAENIVMFITGQKPMSEFDAFLDGIKAMNIDRATEIQQAALDRYNNRLK